jgi:mannose-1-phosphate guanylyltransferase/phosphomannomutase
MKAVIMAGGKGTRLKPLTDGLPKPLVPVLNAPVIDYSLALLDRYDIQETAVTLQHLPEMIMEHLGASAYRDRLYYFLEETPLGTAGSVKNAGKFLDETFIVVSGDALTDLNIEKMLSFHRASNADITIAVKEVDDPSRFGVVCADSIGRVYGFKEKPRPEDCPCNTVSTGIYIIEPNILELIPENRQFDFARGLFPLMLDKHMRIFAYEASGYWCDVGSLGTYFSANMDALFGKLDTAVVSKASAGGGFTEYAGAAVFTGGNVYIGEKVKLRGGVIIGANASIGTGCELTDCIIAEGAEVPAMTKIQNSVISPSFILDIAAVNKEENILPKDNIIPFSMGVLAKSI